MEETKPKRKRGRPAKQTFLSETPGGPWEKVNRATAPIARVWTWGLGGWELSATGRQWQAQP
jgi:AT hook motif